MDRVRLYDDVYAWSEQQAASLCGLSSELDLGNVDEEIEALGSDRRDAAESHIQLILVHPMRLVVAPQASTQKHWRA